MNIKNSVYPKRYTEFLFVVIFLYISEQSRLFPTKFVRRYAVGNGQDHSAIKSTEIEGYFFNSKVRL